MRKKLFAILMSAMMMVTFMPAMAFAATLGADLPQWNDKCASVNYGYVNYKTTRTFDAATGVITATSEAVPGITTATDDNWTDGTTVVSLGGSAYGLKKQYVDLDGAYIAAASLYSSGHAAEFITEARKTAIASPAAYSIANGSEVEGYVVTEAPAGFTNAGTKAFLNSSGWRYYLSTIDYDTTNPYVDQTFTMNVRKAANPTHIDVYGTLASKTLTILATAASAHNATYEVNGYDKTATPVNKLSAFYDGAAHVVSQVAMPGVTSTYKVWDAAQGKDVAVDAVSATDVKEGGYAFTAKATNASATATGTAKEDTHTGTVEIKAANGIKVGFDADSYTELYGDKFNAKDHVEFTAKVVAGATATAQEKAKNEASAKALVANKALIEEYFNEFYDVTVKTDEKTHVTTATIAKKDGLTFTTAQKDALIAKYGQMLKNFGFTVSRDTIVAGMLQNGTMTATVNLADKVTFDNAPLKLKYHNKKGKLAKSYTVTVKAHSESGAKVSYFLTGGGSQIKIDKNTGKITVKKGLKAGKYTVIVNASVGNVYGKNTSVAANSYEMVVELTKKK